MGVYWKAVNIDRHEQVDPHACGDGAKRGECMWEGSATMRTVQKLLADEWRPTDEIRWVSDAGGSEHLAGPVTGRPCEYDDDWADARDRLFRGLLMGADWQKRCEAAEAYIAASPCDPDITAQQWEAYERWLEAKRAHEARP